MLKNKGFRKMKMNYFVIFQKFMQKYTMPMVDCFFFPFIFRTIIYVKKVDLLDHDLCLRAHWSSDFF